jgi:DNA segregation ATPase FtsK/SpoIIIE, S-DNA-T family
MSLDTRGYDPQQRLLPQSLEDRMLGLLGRGCGLVLIVAAIAAWASLFSWSINDPSLTHATAVEPVNWLGRFGAIISDLLLQTFGLAAVFVLAAPLIWGVDLVRHKHLPKGRSKALHLPLSLIAVAGAVSSLPTLEAWPLHHGYGGAVGDSVFGLVANLFAVLSEQRAGIAASVVLWAGAITGGAKTFDVDLQSNLESLSAWLRSKTARHSEMQVSAPTDEAYAHPAMSHTEFAAPAHSDAQAWHGHGHGHASGHGSHQPWQSDDFRLGPAPDLGGVTPDNSFDRVFEPRGGAHMPAPGKDEERGRSFDLFTEAASRAIAQRFAPKASSASDFASVEQAAPQAQQPVVPEKKSGGLSAGLASGLFGGFARPIAKPPNRNQFERPSLNLLKKATPSKAGPEFTQAVMRGNARLLEDVLLDFGVKGEIKDIKPGPVVTLYEFEPARGVKSSRVIGLADDIARSMSVASVRAAVVPGRNVIGLELPNVRREGVLLRDVLEAEAFKASDAALPLALGKTIDGSPIVADLAKMPHLLVAGTTGSGKSVGVNAFILSLLYRRAPSECRLLMIDPKMLELSVYNGIPHLLTPVVTDPSKAVVALNWAVSEMEERYKRMAALSVRNIEVFNNRVRNAKKRGELLQRSVQTGFDASGKAIIEQQTMDFEPLPHIVVVVDEFADLMAVAGKDVEGAVQRLAQMARAAGIHLIMATQRPSVDVVTGTIKANFPTRISFKVSSKIDSRTILNEQGAEQLLGQGDMLYSPGGGQVVRVHGPFVADEEVEAIADALRQQGPPNYVDGMLDAAPPSDIARPSREETEGDLYDRAVAVVLRDRKASTSYIQRRLSIGYNRAADLIERMEREGLISAADPVGRREILVGPGGAADAA